MKKNLSIMLIIFIFLTGTIQAAEDVPEPGKEQAVENIETAPKAPKFTYQTEKIAEAGHKVLLGPKVIREGITIAMVEDPDGNWLELLEQD